MRKQILSVWPRIDGIRTGFTENFPWRTKMTPQILSREDNERVWDDEEKIVRREFGDDACLNRTGNGSPWCMPCVKPKGHDGPCKHEWPKRFEQDDEENDVESSAFLPRPSLLPCPFCGEAEHIILNEVIRGTVAYTNYGCDHCAAQAPQSCDSKTDIRLQQAIAHWNHRSP